MRSLSKSAERSTSWISVNQTHPQRWKVKKILATKKTKFKILASDASLRFVGGSELIVLAKNIKDRIIVAVQNIRTMGREVPRFQMTTASKVRPSKK
jgi:hypothetical protein